MADQNDEWVDLQSETTVPILGNVSQSLVTRSKQIRVRESPVIAKKLYEKIDQCARLRLKTRKSQIVFTTDVDPALLVEQYLKNLSAEYDCSSCCRFIRKYGGLALVDDDGSLIPLFWNHTEVSEMFRGAVATMEDLFRHARVVKQYKPYRGGDKSSTIGIKSDGPWSHLYFNFPERSQVAMQSKNFATVNSKQSTEMLTRLMNAYDLSTAKQALQLLTQHKLQRAEQHIAAAQYLVNFLKIHLPKDDVRRYNLIYQHATAAFTGCLSQLRNGPLGIILGLIKDGESFKQIESQWNHLTAPGNYMRPTAEPTVGSILTAEQHFKDLGLTANDMRRRWLTYADLPENVKLWQRKANRTNTEKIEIFASLLPNSRTKVPKSYNFKTSAPPTEISFVRLLSTILPDASRAWVHLYHRHSLYYYITGLEGTKPLMQWHTCETKDNLENLASYYVYRHPKPVSLSNLRGDAWNELTAVIPIPQLWSAANLPDSLNGKTSLPATGSDAEKELLPNYYQRKEGPRYTLLIDGIKDYSNKRLGLFPTWLHGSLHGVRKVIERYSNEGTKEVMDREEVKEKGGYVGGVQVYRGQKFGNEGKRLLVRTEGKDGEVGVWEIVCFE